MGRESPFRRRMGVKAQCLVNRDPWRLLRRAKEMKLMLLFLTFHGDCSFLPRPLACENLSLAVF